MVKFIQDGNEFIPDNRPNFDHTLFNVKYTNTNNFIVYNKKDDYKIVKCKLRQYYGLVCVNDKYEDYNKIIEDNNPLISEFLKEKLYTFKEFTNTQCSVY